MAEHKIYFGAGPARLPQPVLEAMATAAIDYNGSGLSILEIPHRGKAFAAILEEANALVLQLCGLGGDDYSVMWLQGGGRHQFAMAPMNFLGDEETAGYIDSGHWAHEAAEHAAYYGGVNILSSSQEADYTHLPEWPAHIAESLAYLHFTTNNTIYGTQWKSIPECPAPLIADMSSDIFSMARDYSRCALFYAVAQKNLGPAGVTLVVARKDFMEETKRALPPVFSYAEQAAANSLLNTAPVAAIYTSLLVLRWIAERGIEKIEADNRAKAALLYDAIDQSPHFYGTVDTNSRSLMNVTFRGKTEAVEKDFLAACKARGIEGIEGHRSVGGFRASLYNAVSLEDVKALVECLNGQT